jgi:site-specific DNA-methyltransferase (adenine-specific)
MELRLGRWQDVLADVDHCNTVITDPPYGAGTHTGHNAATQSDGIYRGTINYEPWTPADVAELIVSWSTRTEGWICGMTSDDLTQAYRESYRDAGRYGFAPVPILAHRVRQTGDGPASSAVYMMVSRPKCRPFSAWGALRGWYESKPVRDGKSPTGAKDLGTMRAIVCDYTAPGDVIVDPCAGGGSTLLAAAIEGRYAIGAELAPKTFALACEKLSAGYTPAIPIGKKSKQKQGALL